MDLDTSRELVIDAERLKQNNVQKKSLKENIYENLRKINDEIVVAHRESKYEIITTIPTIFDIPNMSTKVAQRIVWYSIITYLEGKNFNVFINPNKDYCKLKIKWLSKEDEDIIKEQTKTIAEHTKQF